MLSRSKNQKGGGQTQEGENYLAVPNFGHRVCKGGFHLWFATRGGGVGWMAVKVARTMAKAPKKTCKFLCV